ncbi:hypothetical protein [Neorhizobium galegae]|uniref:hypothetical protein n=1 Tax=Neorhizobium galegae TaxID=399 RepID=UPI0006219B88|nr:hypothetical protein [Neorhizobium galegae]KAB1125564.1 hypothetical protein F4V90_00080 [Neorhizobium galegae]MCQ1805823.1 hypothetical protein [Neorhizobium galegae]CDZ59612.1 Hypothetical protein NGAL_HAMBI2566_35950 [Neorhizobium galegae bv. orientalis]
MKTRLQTYLDRFSDTNRPLPLIHTTSTNGFRHILRDKAIKAHKECPVFKEWLVYFFYGRPAYKISVDEATQRVTDEYLPVAFITRPDAVSNIKRIFPFDSGAFDNAAYGGVHHRSSTLADYELAPALKSARRVVRAFFNTNQNYVLGEPQQRRVNAFDNPEVNAYLTLIDGTTDLSIDDRRYSIEIQTLDPVTLANDVVAIVMPLSWLNSKSVRRLLKDNPSIQPLTYARYRGVAVSGCHAMIFERVHDYLSSNGYL